MIQDPALEIKVCVGETFVTSISVSLVWRKRPVFYGFDWAREGDI